MKGIDISATTPKKAALREGITNMMPMDTKMKIHCHTDWRMRGARMALQMAKASPISW